MKATSSLGRGDLYELWHAAERGGEDMSLKVIPSLIGNHLYSGHTLYGRMIERCHWIRERLPGKREPTSDKLHKNMTIIGELFGAAAGELDEQIDLYIRHLQHAKNADHRYDHRRYTMSKHLLSQWFDSIAPFTKAIKEHGPLKQFLKDHQLDELADWNSTEVNNYARYCEKLIKMERCSRASTPFFALRKLMSVQPQELRPADKKALEQWISQLNGKKNYLPPSLIWLLPRFLSSLINQFIAWLYGEVSDLDSETLYRGLHAFFSLSGAKHEIDATLPHLTLRLKEQELKFIVDPDPDYIKWREGLAAGSPIAHPKGTLTIAANITRPSHHAPYFVFTLNDKDLLLVVDINRFLPLIRASRQLQPGITATWMVHQNLSYGFVEKLLPINWKAEEFKANVENIANYIKRCKKLNITPNDFIEGTVGNLRDEEKGIKGKLRAQFPKVQARFSYNGIEQGLARLLIPIEDKKTRKSAYREIIKETGLRPSSVVKAFKEIVERSLKEESNEKLIKSQEEWVRERAKLLHKSVLDTLAKSVLWINENHNPPEKMQVKIMARLKLRIEERAKRDIDKNRTILDLFVVIPERKAEVPNEKWELDLLNIYSDELSKYNPL